MLNFEDRVPNMKFLVALLLIIIKNGMAMLAVFDKVCIFVKILYACIKLHKILDL